MKLEAVLKATMLSPELMSQSWTSPVLSLHLIYLDVFVFFSAVPLLYLIPVRLRTCCIFPLSVMLSPPVMGLFSLSFSFSQAFFSFTINLLLLFVTVVSCAPWIFFLFSFFSLQQNNIICQNRSVS